MRPSATAGTRAPSGSLGTDRDCMAAAVLGLGNMGRHHARILRSTRPIEFVGAVEIDGAAQDAVLAPSRIHRSIGDLLAASGPLDLAVIALPTDQHAEAAVALADAGVNLLIEKPLAMTSGECHDLIAALTRAAVTARVGHVERFNPAVSELRRRIRLGNIGEIRALDTERVGPFSARSENIGVVKDLATHDLDLIHWLVGAPIEEIAARTYCRGGLPPEDMATVTGMLAGGVAFRSRIDWLTPQKSRRLHAIGEEGALVADTVKPELTFLGPGPDWRIDQHSLAERARSGTRLPLPTYEPLRAQIDAFCGLLRDGSASSLATLEDGFRAVRYAETALASAASGASQTVESDTDQTAPLI